MLGCVNESSDWQFFENFLKCNRTLGKEGPPSHVVFLKPQVSTYYLKEDPHLLMEVRRSSLTAILLASSSKRKNWYYCKFEKNTKLSL